MWPVKSTCKILVYCSFFVTLTVLSGCSSLFFSADKDQVEETDYGCAYFYFLWGRQAELSMQYAEALEAYQKALICDSEAEYIVRKIPVLLLRLDRGEEAVSMLAVYLEDKPSDMATRLLLARVFIGLGRYSEAEQQYRIIHQQDPTEVNALLLLSELYLNQSMLDNAEKVLQEVILVNPELYAARVLLARIYINTKRYVEAEAQYDEALKINWSVDLLMEKGDVYRQQEEFDKVIALYREILEKDRANERAALALVNQLLQIDKEEEALVELDKLKDITDLAENVELSVARLFARLEKYEQAIEILRNSLEKVNFADARYLLAVILTQAEKYDQALAELQFIETDKDVFENAMILQVRILRFLERQDEAVELLEKAVADEATRSPDMYVMLAALYHVQDKTLLYEYGLFLETAGRQDEAISIMEEVIKRYPAHGEALNYVGYSWADKSIHLDKALEYIQRAVKLKPKNGYVRDSLGWVYYRLGRIDEAREALEKAVELSGDDPAIFDHLGDVYLELSRKTDAMEMYRKGLAMFEEDEGSELKKTLQEKLQLLESQDEQ
jgi:tetratricopeptide (TPR) repeat protein